MRKLFAGVLVMLAATLGAAAPSTATAAVNPIKILAVGDSISETGAWENDLSNLMVAAGLPAPTITIAAHGGWRCSDWLPTIQSVVAAAQPDITIVSCGTNDAANGVTGAQMDSIYFNLLTDILLGWPQTRILASWIEYSATRSPVPAGLPGGEAVVNDAIYRQTVNSVHGTRIIGTADLQQIPEQYLDAGGIHPTAAGYEAMARIFYNRLRQDAAYPWADVAAPLCGMTGHRPGYGLPAYLPCTTLAGA